MAQSFVVSNPRRCLGLYAAGQKRIGADLHSVRARGSNSFRMQVWSNPQAVEDYKNLLDGKQVERKVDCASVIIGGGKLGTALKNMGLGDDILVKRGESIPEEILNNKGELLTSFPIYVAVKEYDVESVIESCPEARRQDLVFLQTGCMEPVLKKFFLLRKDQTQAVVHWSIAKIGAKPKDKKISLGLDKMGEPKASGETVVCGKWAGAFGERCARAQLSCEETFYIDFRRHMFERVIYLSAFNLVGALHGYPKLDFVSMHFYEEVNELIYELGRSLRATLAVTMLIGTEERLLEYADNADTGVPTLMDPKDFEWRNGFFYKHITGAAIAAGFGDPCEKHTLYLEYGRDNGLLTIPEQ